MANGTAASVSTIERPDVLNLDAICPPELRAEAAAMAAAIDALTAQVVELAADSTALLNRMEREVNPASRRIEADLGVYGRYNNIEGWQITHAVSGQYAIFDAWGRLRDLVAHAQDDREFDEVSS